MSAVAADPADVAVYALRLGDDALVLAQRLSQWCSNAPELEEDLALANVALDLLGQARMLLAHAGEQEGRGRSEDDLAYLRDERGFVNAGIVEQPNGDFACTIARQLLFSTWQHALYERLTRSADATLAAIAAKAVKEVAYHRDHAEQWTLRLGDGTDESRTRMQAGLERIWPYAAELFEADALTLRLVAAGVAVDPVPLQPPWDARVDAVLGAATLVRPQTSWRPTGGRTGVHGEALGFLLAEMQSLHRSLPGVTW
ncbi:MAG TPA: 1,2-phenylacetyl-CoA epoxidase subunit PaaC [Conexibacter sp.]|nr:1,2-phenylacetyl-CoA epoxidase subunit PaaC [Conexibacter sp.]